MTATAVERLTAFKGLLPAHGTAGVASSITILKGTIVTVDSNGYGDTPANGQDAMGIAEHTVKNAGADGAEDVEVAYGVHEVLYSGTAPKRGQVVYVLDNQTVTLDSNGGVRGIAGYCSETGVGGKCAVWFGPHVTASIQVGAAVEAKADEALADTADLDNIEIACPLGSFRNADGTAIGAFSDGVSDGFNLADSEGFGLRLNPEGVTPPVYWTQVKLPDDLDTGASVTVAILAARIGAADTTAAFTVQAFGNTPGAAYDAGADLAAGDTGAVAGATKVVSKVTRAITGAAAGQVLSIGINATTDLDADDMLILGVSVECSRDVGP